MRTSIILDDELAKRLKAKAREKGQSLSAFLAEAGRAALKAEVQSEEEPFELITYGKGGAYPGTNLDRTNELLVAEDERIFGK